MMNEGLPTHQLPLDPLSADATTVAHFSLLGHPRRWCQLFPRPRNLNLLHLPATTQRANAETVAFSPFSPPQTARI